MTIPRVAPNPARFLALVTYVFRACLPGRRRLVLALPCGAALLAGALANALDDPTAEQRLAWVAALALFGLVQPLGTLVIGDAVLGAEVRSGALPFTWLTPTRFGELVIARWLGGWIIALCSLVPACVAAALIAGAPSHAVPIAIAVAAGSAAHIALFVLIGCVTRRAAVWSLAVVFLVERLMGAQLTGIAQISPTRLGQSVYADLASGTFEIERDGIPAGIDAVVRLGLLTTVFLLAATLGVRRLSLTGSRD